MLRYDAPVKIRMEAIDDAVLLGVYNHNSLEEIGRVISRSNRGVRLRMQALAELGFMIYVKNKARSHILTEKGVRYLKDNGLIKD